MAGCVLWARAVASLVRAFAFVATARDPCCAVEVPTATATALALADCVEQFSRDADAAVLAQQLTRLLSTPALSEV